MLQLISEHTGLQCVTLIAGSAPTSETGGYSISVVNYGKTKEAYPRQFSAFDPEGFSNNFVRQFTKFLNKTSGERFGRILACQDADGMPIRFYHERRIW